MKLKVLMAILLCSLGVNTSTSADATTAATLGAATAVNGIVDNLASQVQSVINRLDSAAQQNSFAVRQHLLLLLQNIERVGVELVDKTFGDLNTSQKAFFTQTAQTLKQWESTLDVTTQSVRAVIGSANDALGTIPGAYRAPRVLGYGPMHVLQGRDTVWRVRIDGSWLGSGEPTLTLNGKTCRTHTKLETQLQFECPLSSTPFLGQVKGYTARLTTYYERSLLERVKGFFSDNQKSFSYNIGVFSIPAELGSFNVTGLVSRNQVVTEDMSKSFDFHNGYCEGNHDLNWNVTAREGWKIDPRSVRVAKNFLSENSSIHGSFDVTESGFQVRATARNRGSCARAFGHVVSRDARGAVGVVASWVEYQSKSVTAEVDLGSGKLGWSAPWTVRLPEDLRAAVLVLRPVAGPEQILTSSTDVAKVSNAWVDFNLDVAAKRGILTPKDPVKALGL